MRGGQLDNPLWTQARVLFELREPGGGSARLIRLRRPHGLVGRVVGADISIADTAVGARHAYLHVDERGVFLVDLSSRSGTRVNGEPVESVWLAIGDVVEIAGREIKLREVQLNGLPLSPGNPRDQMLSDADADAEERPLVRLTIEPHQRPGSSWVVGSELVFLGQDESALLRIGGASASNIHCALLRSNTCAYLIDLLVQDARVNNAPVRGSARLADGDILNIGRERFTVHIESVSGEIGAAPRTPTLGPLPRVDRPSSEIVRLDNNAPAPDGSLPFPIESLPAEARESVLAWMMGAIQVSHGELLRRQDELRDALGLVLQQVHDDSSAVLDSHTDRIDALNQELISLRQHIEERGGPAPDRPLEPTPEPTAPPEPIAETASPAPMPATTLATTPASTEPPIPPTRRPPPAELIGPPAPVSERSRETTAWLLHRIDNVDREKRFSFRNWFTFGRPRDEDSRLDDPDQVDEDPDDEIVGDQEGPTNAS